MFPMFSDAEISHISRFAVCPRKSVIGDFKKPEDAAAGKTAERGDPAKKK